MSLQTIMWIFAGVTWGVVFLALLGIVTVRFIQRGVEKRRGNRNNRLTCGFDHTAGTSIEEREKGK